MVRNLARQVTPQTNDSEAQRMCNLQTTRMVFASFTNGLRGNPGIQTRFAMPSAMDDAVRIAGTIEQAELCKGKSETDTEDVLRILNETTQADPLLTQILQTIVFLQARCFIVKARLI